MGTCKECEFWENIKRGYFIEGGDWFVKACTCPKLKQTLKEPEKDELAVDVFDDQGMKLYFQTGQDFGCIHFKAKEEEKG
jgi:hypothetical protein